MRILNHTGPVDLVLQWYPWLSCVVDSGWPQAQRSLQECTGRASMSHISCCWVCQRVPLCSQVPWEASSGVLLLSSLPLSLEIRPSLIANSKALAVGKHLFTCSVRNHGSSAPFFRQAPPWGLKGVCSWLELFSGHLNQQ